MGLLLWRFEVVGLCVCVCFAWWFDWQWWIGVGFCLSVFLLSSHQSGFCDCPLSSHRFGFCDCDGGCFVICKRKVVARPFFFSFLVVDFGCHSGG